MGKTDNTKAKDRFQNGAKSGKDSKGRFVKGNNLGGSSPGRPPQTNKREYLAVMRNTLTEDMWRDLINAMYRDALHGTEYQQAENRKLLFKYNLPQKIELETTGDFTPVVVAVEGFTGWRKDA